MGVSTSSYAQKIRSEKIPPSWIKNKPKALDQGYHFEDIVTDGGSDLSSARSHALNDLARRLGSSATVSSTERLRDSSVTNFDGKNRNFQNLQTYSMDLKIDNNDVNLKYQVIDEYYEKTKSKYGEVFRLYTLFAVSDSPDATFDQFKLTDKYGARGLWRSMIMPGWGQMYKGSTGKGLTMMGGFLATGGGAFACDYLSRYYAVMADRTKDAKIRATYNNWSSSCNLGRNVCIGACAAIYIYSLIDSIVAPGATRVVPVVTADGNAGVGINF